MRNVSFKAVGLGVLATLLVDLLFAAVALAWFVVRIPSDLPDDVYEAQWAASGTSAEFHGFAILTGILAGVAGSYWTARKSASGAIVANGVALCVVGLLLYAALYIFLPPEPTTPAWSDPIGFASVPIATWLGVRMARRRAAR